MRVSVCAKIRELAITFKNEKGNYLVKMGAYTLVVNIVFNNKHLVTLTIRDKRKAVLECPAQQCY